MNLKQQASEVHFDSQAVVQSILFELVLNFVLPLVKFDFVYNIFGCNQIFCVLIGLFAASSTKYKHLSEIRNE